MKHFWGCEKIFFIAAKAQSLISKSNNSNFEQKIRLINISSSFKSGF